MSAEPVGPLFVLDGSDVMVVEEPADVQEQLEAFLVDEPVEIFDALARPVRLVVEGEVRKRWFVEIDGRTTVGVALATGQSQEDRLREVLSNYLLSAGREPPVEIEIQAFTRAAAALIR